MCLPRTRGTAGLESRDLSPSPGARRAVRTGRCPSRGDGREREERGPSRRRRDRARPAAPSLPGMGGDYKPLHIVTLVCHDPLRYYPECYNHRSLRALHCCARPQGRRIGPTGPGDSAEHAGSCSPTGRGFAPQPRARPMGGGPRQEGDAALVRQIPTALSRRAGGAEGPPPSGHGRKSVYSAYLVSLFSPRDVGLGCSPLSSPPSSPCRWNGPAEAGAPPAGPAGSMADPAQCGRCALPPSLFLEALPPLAAAGRSCQSGSGSHGGRE